MAPEGSLIAVTTSNGDAVVQITGELNHLDIGGRQQFTAVNPKSDYEHSSSSATATEVGDDGGVQITCFSEMVNDVTLHFQIIRFPKQDRPSLACVTTTVTKVLARFLLQVEFSSIKPRGLGWKVGPLASLLKRIYAWIGYNSAKFGSLYAAAPTRPNNTVSVTSLLGGASDKTGYSIAHRIVIRTGLNVTLACNIPKDNPMLEVAAQKKLVEKLITLGYTKPKTLKG